MSIVNNINLPKGIKRLHVLTQVFLLLLLLPLSLNAQKASIKGVVIDSISLEKIDYASAVIVDAGSVVKGQGEVNNGNLSIEGIEAGRVQLILMLAGYRTYTSPFFTINTAEQKNVGTLRFQPLDLNLQEVEVVAEKKQIIYKLDKHTINASGNIFALGGTAVDILENTPSIRVSAEGDVTFRGSGGFKVYVNGKPSILEGTQALEQIPASQIEDIEIITTPSARFESDGDVGMINIITKVVEENGVQGVVNARGSTLGTIGTDFLLNFNQGKNRWYLNGIANRIRSESDFKQTKTTDVDGIHTVSNAHGPRVGLNTNLTMKAGWARSEKKNDFLVELQGGWTKNDRTGRMDYSDQRAATSGDPIPEEHYKSHDVFALDQYIMLLNTDYTRKFNDKGHMLQVRFYGKHDWDALEFFESSMFNQQGQLVNSSKAYEKEHRWDVKGYIDYTLPYSDKGKFLAGYEYSLYIEDGDYSIKFWDQPEQTYKWRDDLYNIYFYRRILNCLYAMWNDSLGPLEFQVGLRGEHTNDYLDITMKNASRHNRRFEVFPSAHVSLDASGGNIFSMGYSYRTRRPQIFELEPYITYEDYYTALIGNPDIKPEYIHSLELGYRKNFDGGNSFSATLFHRARKDKMEKVRVAYQAGVTLDSLANVGKDTSSGLELSGQVQMTPRWGMTINGSAYYYDFKAYDTTLGRSTHSYNYEVSLSNNLTLGRNTRLQVDGNLIGPSVSSQGKEDAYCYFNLSLRQQMLKKRLTAVLAFRDILATARYNSHRTSLGLTSLTKVRPKYPSITLTMSYTIGGYSQKEVKTQEGNLFEGSSF